MKRTYEFHHKISNRIPSLFLFVSVAIIGFVFIKNTIADRDSLPFEVEMTENAHDVIQSSEGQMIFVGDFARPMKVDSRGHVDENFGGRDGQGFNRPVHVIVPDGNRGYFVGGEFTAYNQSLAGYLTRLDSTGRIDNEFAVNSGTGFDGRVADIQVLSNGNLLVAGEFRSYNGFAAPHLVELDSTGKLLRSFGVDGAVEKISLINHQMIAIAGAFEQIQNQRAHAFAILNVGGAQ